MERRRLLTCLLLLLISARTASVPIGYVQSATCCPPPSSPCAPLATCRIVSLGLCSASARSEAGHEAGGLGERSLVGIDENDPYLRAVGTFFRRLSSSAMFYNDFWEEKPCHWTAREAGISRPNFGHHNITAAADAGMLGNSGDTYFTEQQGGQLCQSVQDASGARRRAGFFKIDKQLALSGVQMTSQVLERQFSAGATLSINKAGYVWSWVADICRLAMRALGLYANINLYATREGAAVAIPAHNDRQDVFILQLEGHKRWILYRPVEPLPTYEQERGKDHSGPMAIEELSDVYQTHDVVLSPGDILYVPRGYVHETSTVSGTGNEHAHVQSLSCTWLARGSVVAVAGACMRTRTYARMQAHHMKQCMCVFSPRLYALLFFFSRGVVFRSSPHRETLSSLSLTLSRALSPLASRLSPLASRLSLSPLSPSLPPSPPLSLSLLLLLVLPPSPMHARMHPFAYFREVLERRRREPASASRFALGIPALPRLNQRITLDPRP